MTCTEKTNLRCQTLKECGRPLVTEHILDDSHTGHLLLKVGVLNARLDRVEGRGDGDGRDSTRDRGDEVLRPGRLVEVGDAESVFFGYCRGPE